MPVTCKNGWYFGGAFEYQCRIIGLLAGFRKRMLQESRNVSEVESMAEKIYLAMCKYGEE